MDCPDRPVALQIQVIRVQMLVIFCFSIYKDVVTGKSVDTGINFFSFFLFAFPHMLLILLVAWLTLVLMFIGPRSVNSSSHSVI